MTALRILDAAPGLSLQDTGRAGWRRFGVSTAGAMDRLHLAAANRLVGNPAETAALETVLAGFRFEVEAGPLLLAVAGPGMTFQVNGQPVPTGQSALAADGQVVSVSPVREGVYGYLAVGGGFAQAEVMGSRSTHRRSGIGAVDLAPGTSLAVQAADSATAPLRLPMPPAHGKGPIRVIRGPQDDWFDGAALTCLMESHWRTGARSDRMGMVLEGPALSARSGSMVSDGVLAGSIQVPPSGAPIVLMRDCQTTGGYPKIATVISADLDRLSQYRVGEVLRFVEVSQAEAVAALRKARAEIDGLRPEAAIRRLDAEWLLRNNLVDGAWG